MPETDRSRQIIRTSVLGIVVNAVLVLFKMAVGLLVHSIAIILDAVNNLSDALSSVITIVGTKLSGKAPDKKHPYGYGRIEYLTSVLIAALVLLAGATSLRESVEKILHPEAAAYTTASLVIVAAAVLVKFFMGRHVKAVGEKLNAQTLVASGSDALLAALISIFFHVSLEGWLGAIISLIILKSGVEIMLETLNSIIGTRADAELTEAIKREVCAFPGVSGAYDLSLHNYGPTKILGSVHVELPDELPAREIHKLTRAIAAKVAMDYGAILTVGIYAAGDGSELRREMKEKLLALAAQRPEILQVHGFYAEEETRCAMFDLIVDFSADAAAVRDGLVAELASLYPDWRFDVVLDTDVSE